MDPASNGFVVVSVRHTSGSGPVVAAADILTNLKFVLTDPDKKFAKFKLPGRPVAFVGLSEGAHGAIIAADRVMKGELGNLLSSVSALVALAPTPTAKFSNFANSLLILQGTHDGDTPAGGQSMLVYLSLIHI